jgi:hypothetical protein
MQTAIVWFLRISTEISAITEENYKEEETRVRRAETRIRLAL